MNDTALLNPAAVIGSNNPPDPIFAEAAERIANANRWLTERPEITDDEMADKAGGFKTQCAATWKKMDDERKSEKRDYELKLAQKYEDPLGLLARARDAIDGKIRAWLKVKGDRLEAAKREQEAEAERIRQEATKAVAAAEAEAKKKGGNVLQAQAAAEAATKRAEDAAALAAKPVENATVKGTFTTRAITLRTYWHAKIVDEQAALKAFAKHPDIRAAALAAIQKIVEAQATATKDKAKAPAGVEFWTEEK